MRSQREETPPIQKDGDKMTAKSHPLKSAEMKTGLCPWPGEGRGQGVNPGGLWARGGQRPAAVSGGQ